jgi:hypothetical protein
MHPGGVETHVLNLCTAMQSYNKLGLTRTQIQPHVFLFHDKNGEWGGMLPALTETGTPIWRERIQSLELVPGETRTVLRVNETKFQKLVRELRGFDVAMTFYGGGSDRQIGVQAAHLAGTKMQCPMFDSFALLVLPCLSVFCPG